VARGGQLGWEEWTEGGKMATLPLKGKKRKKERRIGDGGGEGNDHSRWRGRGEEGESKVSLLLCRGGQINRYRLTDRLPTLTEPI
jgi:hypothetical protein